MINTITFIDYIEGHYINKKEKLIEDINARLDKYFGNKDVKILYKNGSIKKEDVISKISHDTLNGILEKAFNESEKYKKKIISNVISHSNYMDFLIAILDNEESFLNEKLSLLFISRINYLLKYKRDIVFHHKIYIKDKNNIFGITYHDKDDDEVKWIHNAFYNILLENIESKINSALEENDMMKQVLQQQIIKRQIDKYERFILTPLGEFSNLLKSSYYVSINEKSYYLKGNENFESLLLK